MVKKKLPARIGGLLYGQEEHHLDHLAPLCGLLGIPLLATHQEIAELATEYYPELEVYCFNFAAIGEYIMNTFDMLICCIPRDTFDEAFFIPQKLHGRRVPTIWCPHGNSDKGHQHPLMEGLRKENIALVYGQKMVDFIQEKKADASLERYVFVGDYRRAYFLKHQAFYQKKAHEKIFKTLDPYCKTLLYAPTWQDYENSSSLDSAPSLIHNLPQGWNLIIKLHPNALRQNPSLTEELEKIRSGNSRISLVCRFPSTYPILDAVDAYLGDMSSIGYDFLYRNKPMFFLNPNRRDPKSDKGLFLFRCGREIASVESFYTMLEKDHQEELSSIRKEVYMYTFANVPVSHIAHSLFSIIDVKQVYNDRSDSYSS